MKDLDAITFGITLFIGFSDCLNVIRPQIEEP